ncbi:MAG: DUF1294 domain-containing protein [Clostridia bacterium]|nr:DUF1294 domain-containing protein [Clostridia bacterium]
MLGCLILYIIWNLIVFFTYGLDKLKAIKGWRRLSEGLLLTEAFLMGGIGAHFGMRIFHHKTKHSNFKKLVPFSVVLNITVWFIILVVVFLI